MPCFFWLGGVLRREGAIEHPPAEASHEADVILAYAQEFGMHWFFLQKNPTLQSPSPSQ
jgi:hypothetical protein